MPLDHDFARLFTQRGAMAERQVFTRSARRRFRDRELLDVSHSSAVPAEDPSPAGLATALVDKTMRLRALTIVDAPTMQSLVDEQCRADEVPEQLRSHLLGAFDIALRPDDEVVIRYDQRTNETVVFGPGLLMTMLFGRESMEVVWRMFFCPPPMEPVEDRHKSHLAGLLRVLAHPLRLRILLLLRSGPLLPAQIACSLQVAPDGVDRQLRALRRAKLVSPRRSGDGAQILDVPGVALRILVAIERDPGGWY